MGFIKGDTRSLDYSSNREQPYSNRTPYPQTCSELLIMTRAGIVEIHG